MLIIGWGSKARQGKDTAAEAIVDHFNRENKLRQIHGAIFGKGTQVKVFKFATTLYQEVADFIKWYEGPEKLFQAIADGKAWVPEYREDGMMPHPIYLPNWITMGDPTPSEGLTSPAPYGKHPKLLQWWGTEYRRKHFGENYWVNKMFSSISPETDIALISDVRFLNEAQAIKDRGGNLVNVARLNEDGSQFFATDRPSNHPSETALDSYNWDFRLVNSAGHQALLGEQAITLTEYLRGLSK